ncbi:MAG: helix-turn-helix domain-containing protein [Microcoleaceae cyanobacterium]
MKKSLSFPHFHRKPQQNVSSSQDERAQRLTEVGQQLCQTRLHHAFSIDLVAAYTRIRPDLLKALEEGRMEKLPEAVYTQGLIRRYGDALGLNGQELASFFCPEPIEQPIQSRSHSLSLPQLRPSHLYLTYIVLLAFAVNGLAYLIRTPGELRELAQSPQTTQINASQNSTTAVPEAAQQGTKAQSEPGTVTQSSLTLNSQQAQAKAVQVGITIKDESWVLIEVDGKTEFEGTLPGGTQRTWKAKNELVVVAGNAGGVIITVNDGEAKRLGEPGAVKEAVFKSNSTQESVQNSKS